MRRAAELVGARRADGATPPLPGRPGAGGRVHETSRRVRLADVRPDGRARLDALARYLQDVAADDVRDAGVADERRWVIRRTYLDIARRPRYEELLDLATWCSGTGAAWAERRTSLRGSGGAAVEAASVWVSLDPETMRPVPPGERFHRVFGAAAGQRVVRARLLHQELAAPAGGGEDCPRGDGRLPRGVGERRWALRAADFDVLGHVNNAVAWGLLDEEADLSVPRWRVGSAEVEYREPIAEPGEVTVRRAAGGATLRMEVVRGGGGLALTGLARFEPSPRL